MSGKQAIIDALDLFGSNDVTEEPDDAIITRDLRTLNMMLDAWNTEKLIPYAMSQISETLAPGTQSYVIGDGADFDTTLRPVKVEQGEAYLRVNDSDYQLEVLTAEQYGRVSIKDQSGQPCAVYYEPGTITGTFTFDKNPDQAYTFLLWQRALLAQIDDADTVFYLPPGYAEAITNHLAIRLAPKHGKSVPAEVVEVATNAKANIKRLNMQPQTMQADTAVLTRGIYDIYSGTIR